MSEVQKVRFRGLEQLLAVLFILGGVLKALLLLGEDGGTLTGAAQGFEDWAMMITPWLTVVLAFVMGGMMLVGLREGMVRSTARPLEILLGAYFLWGALMKGLDPNAFAGQIRAYGVLEEPLAFGWTAVGTIGLEAALGLGMLLGLRLFNSVLLGVAVMLLGFIGLIGYAWSCEGLSNCGCLGGVKVTPQEAIFKNIIMLIWIGVILRGMSLQVAVAGGGEGVKLMLALLLAAGAVAYTYPQVFQEGVVTPVVEESGADEDGEEALEAGKFATVQFESDVGEPFDLSEGTYIVAMLSMTCEHCMATVPLLQDYMMNPDAPRVVALCMEPNPGDMDTFKAFTGADFPMYNMGSSIITFGEFIGSAPPRVSLVQDGHELAYWDDDAPPIEEILAALDEASVVDESEVGVESESEDTPDDAQAACKGPWELLLGLVEDLKGVVDPA